MFLKFITQIQNVELSVEIVSIPKIYKFLLNHYLTMSGNSKLQTLIKQVPNYLLTLNKLTVGTNSSIFLLIFIFCEDFKRNLSIKYTINKKKIWGETFPTPLSIFIQTETKIIVIISRYVGMHCVIYSNKL